MEPEKPTNAVLLNRDDKTPLSTTTKVRAGLILSLFGFSVFFLGLRPDFFGLDRGYSVGFLQIIIMLIGIGISTGGALLVLVSRWDNQTLSITADLGTRVVATGFVICIFTSLADAFGFGTNSLTDVFLGKLQSRGLIIGVLVILTGLLMVLRYPQRKTQQKKSEQD